jgi:hypothetical protein
MTYYPPGLAIWDLREEPAQLRTRQFARSMLGFDVAQAEAILSEVLPGMPAYDAFWLLEEVRRGASLAVSLRLLERCRPGLHPEVARAFGEALREEGRRAAISRKRQQVRDPGLRHFLAILLNAQNRRDALSLAGAYAPERSAVDSVLGWLGGLANVKLSLQTGGEPWEPNVFGLPEFDEPSREALRSALEGRPASPGSPAPFHEAVMRAPAFAPLFRA